MPGRATHTSDNLKSLDKEIDLENYLMVGWHPLYNILRKDQAMFLLNFWNKVFLQAYKNYPKRMQC